MPKYILWRIVLWKTARLSFLGPLIVVIFGGIILFHYSDFFADPKKKFDWNIQNISALNFNNETYFAITLNIDNSLDHRVENVAVEISFDSKVSDVQAFASSHGVDVPLTMEESETGLVLGLAHLRSGESLHLQIFVKADKIISPNFRVYSNQYEALQSATNESFESKFVYLSVLALIRIVIIFLPILFILFFRRRIMENIYSRNNTAFSLMHSDNPSDAVKLLKDTILSKGGSVFLMSNLAGALALDGKLQEAEKYISAAKILSLNSSKSWIIALNDALISYAKNDLIGAVENLNHFKKLSPRTFANYIKFSEPLKSIQTIP